MKILLEFGSMGEVLEWAKGIAENPENIPIRADKLLTVEASTRR